ncbi:RHS repeat-associated core domain-containing protein, partial [Alteromonas sp. PRIM-21]|uniref:RHS repeat-associated core domain-containing protein n=1 Tax=Alteromonas sp. PRIM-21 TaxID=1454978 RepID=UPI0022B9C5B1
MIAELADDNSVAKAYTFGNDLISQTDLSTSNTSYFHYDGQGNTRNLSDTNGLSDSYTFDAFGTLLNTDGITDNDYLYSGEQFDAQLDNYYLRARYYDQNVGRFTQ